MNDDTMVMSSHKADFSTIYDRPDPRGYFATLSALDYQIPQTALPVIETLLAASTPESGRPRDVLDVCCSYGINAALLRYDVDIEQLAQHYTAPDSADSDPGELRSSDARWFAARSKRPELRVLGLDASAPAISYATDVGLLTDGWAENLEDDDASTALAAGMKGVGLITCTGGVGYIGAPTFRRLLSLVDEPAELWLAVFVLRAFPYDEVAAVLDDAGLVTEQLTGRTFRQRRFASQDEQEAAMHDVASRGLDPAGKEAEGWLHADCFVTRPAAAAAATPITDLLPA